MSSHLPASHPEGPPEPLPAPLRGAETGSFAWHTVTVRMPEIGRRILTENTFPAEIAARLEGLFAELPEGRVRPLQDDGAPDRADWERYVTPYIGQNWLEVPWFFAETYYYRRILEATGYFQPGRWQGFDPFASQKRQGLTGSRGAILALVGLLDQAFLDPGPQSLTRLLQANLWGNQADLSQLGSGKQGKTGQPGSHQQPEKARQGLVVDHTSWLLEQLDPLRRPSGPVDFVLDNAGLELVGDLVLADYLLGRQPAVTVRFHLKPHPTFVSDAMIKDVQETIQFLAADSYPPVHRLGDRLAAALGEDRLLLADHFFWTSPLSGWEMPGPLRSELRAAGLLVTKGDANYRRLLGDRHWPQTTPFHEIVRYFPAPLAALRVLKSEIVVGLQPGQAESLDQEDPRWLVDGKWALIQS